MVFCLVALVFCCWGEMDAYDVPLPTRQVIVLHTMPTASSCLPGIALYKQILVLGDDTHDLMDTGHHTQAPVDLPSPSLHGMTCHPPAFIKEVPSIVVVYPEQQRVNYICSSSFYCLR